MPTDERGNLLGECDLIMSFLCYNNISAMSRLHRSASAQMSRSAISIHKSGGWTFGSPSVLMMYYRTPGELQSELAEMDECMPYYYRITNGHGKGAEKIMLAEAAFQQSRFTDAHIQLEHAYAQIEENGQVNVERKYISAVRPLENFILQVDFVSGSRLHKPDSLRRRVGANEQQHKF